MQKNKNKNKKDASALFMERGGHAKHRAPGPPEEPYFEVHDWTNCVFPSASVSAFRIEHNASALPPTSVVLWTMQTFVIAVSGRGEGTLPSKCHGREIKPHRYRGLGCRVNPDKWPLLGRKKAIYATRDTYVASQGLYNRV